MSLDQTIVKVDSLYKSFRLPHEKHNGVKQALISMMKGDHGFEVQEVLNDISFEIKRGEFFGIVGKNGSGKSTLLKLLAGIYSPDKGVSHIDGEVTPFIELGVGFNPELTGRDNVYLNSALLGMSKEEVDGVYDEIVSFAELERFMDQRLKNYSSGMQVRLAFSIAIRAKSDVLIMDEVLAVGDAAFQKKCFDVFRRLKKEGRTIILVTHEMGNVEKFCDRVLILSKGKILDITTPDQASAIYARLNIDENIVEAGKTDAESNKRYGTGEVRVTNISLGNGKNETKIFNTGDDLEVTIELDRQPGEEYTPLACGLAIFNEDGINILGPNSERSDIKSNAKKITCAIPNLSLVPGSYDVTVAVYHKDNFVDFYDLLDKWTSFSIVSNHTMHGLIEVESLWTSE